MEVKPGYKQTEVGVIPEDWGVEQLRTLADSKRPISYGIVQTGPRVPNGVRCLRVLDIDDGRINKSNLITTTKTISGAYKKTVLRAGDLVMPLRGKVGDVASVDDDLTGCNLTRGLALIAIRSDWSTSFCKQSISSTATRVRLEQSMNGSALQEIPIATLRLFKIALPPTKAEQEAIAAALSDADALIESMEQLLVKKRQLKQGAMQELLTGKKRLPGFQIKPGYKQTEMGVIPEDWEVAPVGQRLRRTPSYGINAPATSLDSRFLTYLRITDITEDGRFSDANKASVDHPAAASYLLEPGDVVFARTGASVGKSYLYDPKDGRLVFAGFLIRLSPDPDRLVPAILSFYAQSRPYWNWVKVNSMRTGQPGINGREYASLPIALPPTKAEQEAIATILSDMDAEIAALEAKLTKARQIKQGMMQELLTGRIRLV